MKQAILILIGAVVASPAGAANVNFTASLASSCVLSVGTSGVMTTNSALTQLGSENSGGVAATLVMSAIGSNPTVTVGAPSLSQSPAGWSATHTMAIKYTSLRGANQDYTSSQTTFSPGALADTITFNGKVDSANGFAAGNYALTSVVTCG